MFVFVRCNLAVENLNFPAIFRVDTCVNNSLVNCTFQSIYLFIGGVVNCCGLNSVNR